MEQYRIEISGTANGQYKVERQWHIKDDLWQKVDMYITPDLARAPKKFHGKEWAQQTAQWAPKQLGLAPVVEALEAATGTSISDIVDSVLAGNGDELATKIALNARKEMLGDEIAELVKEVSPIAQLEKDPRVLVDHVERKFKVATEAGLKKFVEEDEDKYKI